MVMPGSGVGTPSVMSPKIMVRMPTMNRLSPQVASIVSTMRP